MNKKTFKVTQSPGLPPYIKSEQIKIWKEQLEALDKHLTFKDYIYFIEWPDFMQNTFKKTSTPEKITQWEKSPLLRDTEYTIKVDLPTIWVKKDWLYDTIEVLKDDITFSYNFLLDLTAVDLLNSHDPEDLKKNQNKRFQMLYLLRSLKFKGMKIRLIVPIDENDNVPSLTKYWAGANWPEREVYDLMGICFENHPNLRRILMPDEYRGHPLRKDFPLKGIGEDYLIKDLLEDFVST